MFSTAVSAKPEIQATTPYWLQNPSRLHDFQSTAELPKHVDVVIVGAGIKGVALAYFLNKMGFKVAVLDRGGAGEGASGRNGGHFPKVPSNFIGGYHGLVAERTKYLTKAFPERPAEMIARQAEDQARRILALGDANPRLLTEIMTELDVDADVESAGTVLIAEDQQGEDGLRKDVELMLSVGIEAEFWDKEKVFEKTGVKSEWGARYTPASGNYHPYKYVTGAFEGLIKRGVLLFTQTNVESIDHRAGSPAVVHTSRGEISSQVVIVATDGYSKKLMPELAMVIPNQSHIATWNGVLDRFNGLSVEKHNGDSYNQVIAETKYIGPDGKPMGTAMSGGGEDVYLADPDHPQMRPREYALLRKWAAEVNPEAGQREPDLQWTGVFGVTADKISILGPISQDPNDWSLWADVGSEGYGGVWWTALAQITSEAVAQVLLYNTPRAEAILAEKAPPGYYAPWRFEQSFRLRCTRAVTAGIAAAKKLFRPLAQ